MLKEISVSKSGVGDKCSAVHMNIHNAFNQQSVDREHAELVSKSSIHKSIYAVDY